jgi:hypothetical protein
MRRMSAEALRKFDIPFKPSESLSQRIRLANGIIQDARSDTRGTRRVGLPLVSTSEAKRAHGDRDRDGSSQAVENASKVAPDEIDNTQDQNNSLSVIDKAHHELSSGDHPAGSPDKPSPSSHSLPQEEDLIDFTDDVDSGRDGREATGHIDGSTSTNPAWTKVTPSEKTRELETPQTPKTPPGLGAPIPSRLAAFDALLEGGSVNNDPESATQPAETHSSLDKPRDSTLTAPSIFEEDTQALSTVPQMVLPEIRGPVVETECNNSTPIDEAVFHQAGSLSLQTPLAGSEAATEEIEPLGGVELPLQHDADRKSPPVPNRKQERRETRQRLTHAWSVREAARAKALGSWSTDVMDELKAATNAYTTERSELQRLSNGKLNDDDAHWFPVLLDQSLETPRVRPPNAPVLHGKMKTKVESSSAQTPVATADQRIEKAKEEMESASKLLRQAQEYAQTWDESKSYESWQQAHEQKMARAKKYYKGRYAALQDVFGSDGLPAELAERYRPIM